MDNTVYVVRSFVFYDDTTEIVGIATSFERGEEIIKEYLTNIHNSYYETRFEIMEYRLDTRWGHRKSVYYNQDKLIEMAKELGVYNG